MSTVRLTNPHSILATFRYRPRDVLEVRASAGKGNESWKDVVTLARDHGVPVKDPLPPQQRKAHARDDGGRIGTTFAIVRERTPVELEDLFAPPITRGLWLALDQIQDPHNVGAIFRTAAFFGVQGIVLTQDKSAPVTATVYDVAAGGVESVPFVLQTNLVQALKVAKKRDMWVLGTSEHADLPLAEIDRDRRWLLVLGNEEKGLRRLTLENCDQTCQIPPRGDVTSLNVSVAAGVLISTLTAPL